MAKQRLQLVTKMIRSDFVVIFSKTYCPHCRLVKKLFYKLNEPYTCYELDKRKDGEDIQNILGNITGARTVPRIFIEGKCLGGASDFQSMYSNGALHTLLNMKPDLET